MRVISGTARGRKLRTLELPHLRPMLDRVKEALFNIIRGELEGARVLDLFSGCGALGIEALSRGAAACVFVESDRRLAELIGQNLSACGLEGASRVVAANVWALCAMPPPEGLPADVVLADPPYADVDDPNRRSELFGVLESMIGGWVVPGALVVLHHAPMPHAIWPTQRMQCLDRRVYGRSQITLFEVAKESADGRQ